MAKANRIIGLGLTLAAIGWSTSSVAQLSTQSADAQTMANEIAGGGISVSNAQFTGSSSAGGLFFNGSAINLDDGIVLSTGNIASLGGPNSSDETTTSFDEPGDSDLSDLIDDTTNDAAVLEFDFVPDQDVVTFRYVFGSEEYLEFVDSSFNDVFGFFVNGQNCALVDDDPPNPVSVNTINNQVNSNLYVNNPVGPSGVELDGFTRVLTCVADVTPNQTNTMKLAIADTSDTLLDSAVFIESGSFVSGFNPVVSIFANPDSGEAPLNVDFDTSGVDGDGPLSSWTFSFGDDSPNESGQGNPPTSFNHTYTQAGQYFARLTVTDSDFNIVSRAAEINVSEPVNNDIALISFGQSSVSATEGTSVSLEVNRAGNTQTNVDVRVTLSSDQATPGADFSAGPFDLAFLSGETSKTVSIDIIDDSEEEPAEDILASAAVLSDNGNVVAPATSTIIIAASDAPAPPVQMLTISNDDGQDFDIAVNQGNISAQFIQPFANPPDLNDPVDPILFLADGFPTGNTIRFTIGLPPDTNVETAFICDNNGQNCAEVTGQLANSSSFIIAKNGISILGRTLEMTIEDGGPFDPDATADAKIGGTLVMGGIFDRAGNGGGNNGGGGAPSAWWLLLLGTMAMARGFRANRS
ncbi:MAG: choice-of-anchor L domain-containing protein [Panacagrimonas sp.]